MHKYSMIYDPEHFPGLKISLSLVTAVVFHTGKVTLTGAKTKSDLEKSRDELSLALSQA